MLTGENVGHQLAALVITVVLGLAGGLFTGLLIKSPCFLYEGRIQVDCLAACLARDAVVLLDYARWRIFSVV